MTNDNEENAEISLKTMIEMQKYYKTQQDILVSWPLLMLIGWQIQQFLQLLSRVVQEHAWQAPSYLFTRGEL